MILKGRQNSRSKTLLLSLNPVLKIMFWFCSLFILYVAILQTLVGRKGIYKELCVKITTIVVLDYDTLYGLCHVMPHSLRPITQPAAPFTNLHKPPGSSSITGCPVWEGTWVVLPCLLWQLITQSNRGDRESPCAAVQ